MAASLESIDRILTVAGLLLDSAATEIRDADLQPCQANIEAIGRALAEVFQIQETIYAARPELRPCFLSEQSPFPEANRLLTAYMYRASELEREGKIEAAILEFEHFILLNSCPLHRQIAEWEIERLRQGGPA